jgi:hypothetical protein
MFSGRFVAPTWDRYSSFAQLWLIAHKKIQDLWQKNKKTHIDAEAVMVTKLSTEKNLKFLCWIMCDDENFYLQRIVHAYFHTEEW